MPRLDPDTNRSGARPGFQTLAAADHDAWDLFAEGPGGGTIFHTAWWYRAWGMEPVVRVLRDAHGRIEAGICYAIGRRWGVPCVARPPLTPRNGPLFAAPAGQGSYKAITHAKKMMLTALHSLPKLGLYDFTLRECDTDLMPFMWNGFDILGHYTYVLPCADRDTWPNHASSTSRNLLRRAAKDADEGGFQVDAEPRLEEIFAMIQETADAKRYSMAAWRDRAPAWWDAVCRRHAGRAYVVRDRQGQLLAADVFIYDRRCAYSILRGMRTDLRKGSNVGVFLLQRVIREAHEMNLDFDFEGSVLPGVERFIRSFGGELRWLPRVVKPRSLPAFLMWCGYRFWNGYRKSQWVWHD